MKICDCMSAAVWGLHDSLFSTICLLVREAVFPSDWEEAFFVNLFAPLPVGISWHFLFSVFFLMTFSMRPGKQIFLFHALCREVVLADIDVEKCAGAVICRSSCRLALDKKWTSLNATPSRKGQTELDVARLYALS